MDYALLTGRQKDNTESIQRTIKDFNKVARKREYTRYACTKCGRNVRRDAHVCSNALCGAVFVN